MDLLTNNPESNRLPEGFQHDALVAAVEKSGFPVQTIVAHKLASTFPAIEEEWSYIDQDEDKQRAIDVYAYRSLEDEERVVSASLVLLVECKRSDTPYVFHLRNRAPPLDFPALCGLPSTAMEIWIDNRTCTYRSAVEALGIVCEPFVADAFPVAYSFTRARLGSGKVKLSDDNETYPQLILPLIKASQHLERALKGSREQPRRFVSALVPVAVLDAPMIGAWYLNGEISLAMAPWVRVIRHSTELDRRQGVYRRTRFAVDVVHKDFLDVYVNDHLMPFSDSFMARVHAHERELLEGKGEIHGLNVRGGDGDLGTRLRPVT